MCKGPDFGHGMALNEGIFFLKPNMTRDCGKKSRLVVILMRLERESRAHSHVVIVKHVQGQLYLIDNSH